VAGGIRARRALCSELRSFGRQLGKHGDLAIRERLSAGRGERPPSHDLAAERHQGTRHKLFRAGTSARRAAAAPLPADPYRSALLLLGSGLGRAGHEADGDSRVHGRAGIGRDCSLADARTSVGPVWADVRRVDVQDMLLATPRARPDRLVAGLVRNGRAELVVALGQLLVVDDSRVSLAVPGRPQRDPVTRRRTNATELDHPAVREARRRIRSSDRH
jgi:hypothetical protein